jgi:hypothetical protein
MIQILVLARFPGRGRPSPACAAGSGTIRGVVTRHEEDSQSQEERLRLPSLARCLVALA